MYSEYNGVGMDLLEKFEEDIFPIMLCKMHKNMQKQYDEILKPYGLSKFHSFYLLCLLKFKKGLKLNDLNEIIGCDKANTSRAIADLEDKDIICKDIPEDKEKKYFVKLTEYGKKIAQKFYESSREFYNRIFNKLTRDDQEKFYEIMLKMTN